MCVCCVYVPFYLGIFCPYLEFFFDIVGFVVVVVVVVSLLAFGASCDPQRSHCASNYAERTWFTDN